MNLGIPNIPFPIEGEMMQSSSRMMSNSPRMQSSARMSKLKGEGLRMMDWQSTQKMESRVMPSFRMKGHMLGMTAYQIIAFSLYQILTAPENIGVIT